MDLPHLPEEEKAEEAGTLGLIVWDGDMGQGANLGPFDDEETRAFYTDLPDLLDMLPSVGKEMNEGGGMEGLGYVMMMMDCVLMYVCNVCCYNRR